MNTTTSTTASTIQISRARLCGLIVAVVALAAALTWTLTTLVVDTAPEQAGTANPITQNALAGNPGATAAAGRLVGSDAQPIIVADAYHGVGFMVCRDDARPATIADSYHGIGIAVCV